MGVDVDDQLLGTHEDHPTYRAQVGGLLKAGHLQVYKTKLFNLVLNIIQYCLWLHTVQLVYPQPVGALVAPPGLEAYSPRCCIGMSHDMN